MNKLHTGASPHLRSFLRTYHIMLCVLIALIPSALTGILAFGFHALLVLLTSMACAVFSELMIQLILRRMPAVTDCSALVTGLILGMNLPPDTPLYIAALGSAFAIIAVKQFFGGLGQNFANPAVTARILLMLVFPLQMSTFRDPLTGAAVSAETIASGNASLWDLFLGNTAGCIGTVCTAAVLAGGLFLCLTGIVHFALPLSFLGCYSVLTVLSGTALLPQLLSGALLLGAFFMAADPVTAPLTTSGKTVFGLGCGLLTFLVQHYGGFPEGVFFAILIMDLFTPLIGKLTAPVPLGMRGEGPAKA